MSSLRTLKCLGNSQWPFLKEGDQIGVTAVLSSELKRGDLVLFKRGKVKRCHRVLKIREESNGIRSFYLKGDSLLTSDGWIKEDEVLSKVVTVNGRQLESLRTRSVSSLFFYHSLLQSCLFDTVFLSPLGRKLGRVSNSLFKRPVFMDIFHKVTTPWLLCRRSLE